MLEGGNFRAVLFLVGFLGSPECDDSCDSKFERSSGGDKMPLLEI
jgi:hypothetical protein